MAYTPEQQSIIDQATAINPSNPRLALWEWTQSKGYSPDYVDQYMGWAPGATLEWAVQNGQAPAPQGNFNVRADEPVAQAPAPVAPAPAQQPTPAAPAAPVQPSIPSQPGPGPAAQQPAQPGTPMGTPATAPRTDTRNYQSSLIKALRDSTPQGAPAAGVSMLPPNYNAGQQSIIGEATSRARANNTTPELEAWNYAMGQNNNDPSKSAGMIDSFFEWNPGTSMQWAINNGQYQMPKAQTQATSTIEALRTPGTAR